MELKIKIKLNYKYQISA